MPIRAAIEIDAARRDLQADVASAYRLSREGVVVLLLSGVPRATIDRCLDAVVREEGTHVAGVRYFESGDDNARLTVALRSAREVIVRSEKLWSRLTANGIRAVRASA